MTQPYQRTSGANIIRVVDGACIPADPANADYQAYEAWVVAGNTPDPVPTPPAPTVAQQIAALEAAVTPRRIREAVLGIDNNWLKNLNDQIATLRGQVR